MLKSVWLLVALLLGGCKGSNLSTTKAEVQPDTIGHNVLKPARRNDDFRQMVLPAVEARELSSFEKILDALDQRNVLVCDYYKDDLRYDDSCYAVARSKFEENSIPYFDYHDKVYEKHRPPFLKKYGLTEAQAMVLGYYMITIKDAKAYCGSN